MKLRTILLILSLLALASTTVGGMSYYYSLRETASAVAHKSAVARTEMIRNQLSAFLTENLKTVKVLAGLDQIRRAVAWPDSANLEAANLLLDHFQKSLQVDVCYLMNRNGDTIATSNRRAPDSFLGKNFSFRPYFKLAINGMPAKYLALGTTSGKRGAYYSHPVYAPGERDRPRGVVVIKAPIRVMEKNIIAASGGITMLVDPYGVIFSCSRKQWLFKTLWKLSPEEISDLAASRQFGEGPWRWVGLRFTGDNRVTDPQGREYLFYSLDVENYLGWKVIHLQSLQSLSKEMFNPLVRTTGIAVLMLCLVAGLAAYYLYRKASLEIERRQEAERELRESEQRYRSLYHKTPAMLQTIDPSGRLVGVSDYWTAALGYRAPEVIGRRLSDFLTEESRRRAEETILPGFFQTGVCKDQMLQFRKKSGEVIDVLFSAVAEWDSQGRISRCLAVLVDITERKRTEEKLKRAREKLSSYSKDLERQVRERTREITGFLQYTPAVVYMKDPEGRYILVNSRHEELFGVKNADIKGKTVYDVFPKEIADQFRRNDLKVLHEKRYRQTEEIMPHGDQMHTYLAVRFPILDENQQVSRLCGISIDITDIKKAQDQLRRLSGAIMASQEKERAAIARELHDELGQVLTALRMDAVWLKERLDRADSQLARRAATMVELIDSTISEVRGISTRLRPAVLDDLGLIDALEWQAGDFEKRTGISCVFTRHQVPEVDEYLAIAVYRVAQEALTNVARHSGAGHVEMRLVAQGGILTLTVRDDGRGFDPQSLAEKDKIGLAGMQERAALAGGVLEIRSRPGQGTEVRLRLPLHDFTGAEL